ncbi:MAG: NAD-dependent epimerase/dehydratase family protein [archaeon]
MSKILVTGGAGFIGSHVVDMLLANGHRVFVVDNLSTGVKENVNPRANFYNLDLGDENSVKEIFEKEKPEIVYHLAAQIDVRKSLEKPVEDARINILHTLHLLELSREHGVKHFIFSSTGGAIYGDTRNLPTPEEENEEPVSPYGCAKLAVEKYLNYYTKVHGMKVTVLRYSNVYGPRQNPKGEAGVISIFLESLLARKKPIIFGGIQTRDFVFVKDVAKANLLALNSELSEVYNVGTGKETDIIEVYSKLNKFFKKKIEPEYRERRAGEQMKSSLHCGKIRAHLGWQAETSLDEGLAQTYAWFLTRNNLS